MLRKSILKAVLVISIALAMCVPASAIPTKTKTDSIVSLNPATMNRDVIFEDGFENYTDWLTNFPPWTCIDVDGSPTFGHSAVTWPNQWTPYAFIIFNPSTTTPPQSAPEWLPHSGNKMVMGVNEDNVGYISDDWLITPQLSGDYDEVSFWARSFSSQYNLERFTVSVSTTDTNPSSFTMISPGSYIQPPLTWTQYTFDISSYSGQSIYIGIHDISVDSWMLFIDDFVVTGTGGGDTTPPVTTATLEGEQSGDVYISDVKVTLTATDSGSGVNYTMYKIDDGAWNTYTAPFMVTGNGDHIVAFYSVDIAGNIEDEKSVEFTIQYPLEVTVKGGIGITMTIKNNGTTDITDVTWSIALEGGVLLKGDYAEGTVLQIPAGQESAKKHSVLGFGKTTITVTVNGAVTTKQGFVLLFFVIGVK